MIDKQRAWSDVTEKSQNQQDRAEVGSLPAFTCMQGNASKAPLWRNPQNLFWEISMLWCLSVH